MAVNWKKLGKRDAVVLLQALNLFREAEGDTACEEDDQATKRACERRVARAKKLYEDIAAGQGGR